MQGKEPEILVDATQQGVLRLVLNRPQQRNAFTLEMYEQLANELESARARDDLHAVVITGSGEAFSSGGDVRRMATCAGSLSATQRELNLLSRSRIVQLLHSFPVPSMAVMRGPAVGSGLSIAMACDIRICDRTARLRTGFLRLALSGDFGGHYFVPKVAGGSVARELYLLDEWLDAARALQVGLVHKVVDEDKLLDAEREIIQRWVATPVYSLRQLKLNLVEAANRSLDEVLTMEARRHVACVTSEGHRSAVVRLQTNSRNSLGGERG